MYDGTCKTHVSENEGGFTNGQILHLISKQLPNDNDIEAF